MSACGNGHGCEATYSTDTTSTPVSSRASRITASSGVSPGSTNPAKADHRFSGAPRRRLSRQRSPDCTSIVIAGSVRGKWFRPHTGQWRRWPAASTAVALPHRPQ